MDEEERNEVEKKNNSLQFQQIMHEKAGVLKLLDCSKIEGHVLADYLKEFQNYPVAVELFRAAALIRKIRPLSLDAFRMIPEENARTE